MEDGKDKEGKAQIILKTGNQSVALPGDKKWKKQVFIEPKTNIPFVSDGSTSVHCIRFFQDEENATKDGEVSHPSASLTVPLPGAPNPEKTKHTEPPKEGPFSSRDDVFLAVQDIVFNCCKNDSVLTSVCDSMCVSSARQEF